MQVTFGPIRQIAFVTRDMGRSMDFYTRNLGIGPWFSTRRAVFKQCRYRGEACQMQLAAALAAWGPIQIELVQQLDDSPSIFNDWMRRPFEREIQQHVAYWTTDYDGALSLAHARGFVVEQDGETPWGRFAYLLHPDNPDQVIEFTDATSQRQTFNAAIAAAALNWDGSDPIRPFSAATSA
jgi:hypothetical protein